MNGMFSFASRTFLAYGVLAIVCSVAVGYWYLSPREEMEVVVVTSGEFVQEVSASGKVESTQSVDLGFSQGGRVASVAVNVGDRVNAGDILVRLEQSELRASRLQKEAILASERAQLAELEQGVRPEEIAIAEADVAQKKSVLAQARQSLFEAVQESYVVAQDALFNRIDQFVVNPRSAFPEIIVSIDNSDFLADFTDARVAIQERFALWKPLSGASSPDALLEGLVVARTNLSELANLLSIAATALSRAVPTVAYPTATILGYASDVATGRNNVQNTIADLTSAETAYRNAETGLISAQKNLVLKQAGTTATSIAAQRAQVRAAEADVAAAAALIEKTEIRAPFDGTITAIDAKIGAILTGSETAVSMIGSGGFEVESYIPEINIALISVGDPVRVTLDAYGPSISFPARVAAIDPAETVRDGVSTYRILIAFDAADERIRSGMTANVVMTTDRRDSVISIPQGLVRVRDGVSFVIVAKDGVRTERPVTTGMISSMGTIEILSGLQVGEVLPISD